MRKILALLLALVLVVGLAACGGGTPAPTAPPDPTDPPANGGQEAPPTDDDPFADAPNVRFMLAENQAVHNPISIGMMLFAELVYEKTEGTVYIDVFLDGQLGSEGDTVTQVQAGTLDMVRANASSFVPIADHMGVLMMPFLFEDDDHKYRVLDGEIGAELIDELEDYGFVTLEFWEAGSRNFYSRTPIHTVEDIQGMMVRVLPVEMAMAMVDALGASSVSVPFAEIYQALQTGVIDAAENDFVSYYTGAHHEVAPYFTLSGHMSPPALLVIGTGAWNQLTPAQQEAMREAAREAVLWQRQAMMDFQLESRERVEAAGTTVIEVDLAPFQAAMAQVYDMYPQHAARIQAILALS